MTNATAEKKQKTEQWQIGFEKYYNHNIGYSFQTITLWLDVLGLFQIKTLGANKNMRPRQNQDSGTKIKIQSTNSKMLRKET